jgi:hypothetical protein
MSPNNVVAIRNIVVGQKSFIAKIIIKNNGVWHTNLATPNMLLGAWVPKVEPDNLMVIINPLVGMLDVSIEVQILSVNMKDCGK